jgi:hypothetical protein
LECGNLLPLFGSNDHLREKPCTAADEKKPLCGKLKAVMNYRTPKRVMTPLTQVPAFPGSPHFPPDLGLL